MRGKLAGVAFTAVTLLAATYAVWPVPAQKPAKDEPLPRRQDKMPGPALSPAEAIRKMTVPEGFTVELVAAEPDIVNPVAMTFDERGRIWITESVEYPRQSAGPGKDRVKVLESTKGDGNYDKITIFADGLNIPSGIAVGHGGVWVANAPDILFFKEKDGKADGPPQVVVTGFGRSDTHEVPNSLTWGPDGWLYGLNGVFNQSRVKYRGKEYDFTCAMFRIHPKTKDFELFCEGTSNPWGIAFDHEGSAFVSACVIDHLWHLVETGYYHRQGGPYPPYTWKLESIVKHHHQLAAYCGLHFFDSDAYPPEYRERLYMGNIHGSCINVDVLERSGATYFAKPAPDFLTANDPWFMPVAQRTGPDGCLYILDWYDRYHCYQDANRDPAGVDRRHGRLYRVRYKDTPRAGSFDLARESDDQLIQRLHSPNVFFRDLAQRLLCERNTPATRAKLEKLVLDDNAPHKTRMHALFALVGTGTLEPGFHQQLLAHKEASYRAWGVRAAGNYRKVDDAIRARVLALADDPAPDVKLQVAIAARKLEGVDSLRLLLRVLNSCGEDKLIPVIVWQNLHPLLEAQGEAFVALTANYDTAKAPALAQILPRALERMLGSKSGGNAVATLLRLQVEGKAADPKAGQQCLMALTGKIQNGEIAGPQLDRLRAQVLPLTKKLLGPSGAPLALDAALLAATLKDPEGLKLARSYFFATSQFEETSLKVLNALVAAGDTTVLDRVAAGLADPRTGSPRYRGQTLAALGRLDDPSVAERVLAIYPRLEPDLRPRAVELLTQRPSWAKQLLQAIAQKKLSADALNVNQVRQLLASKDQELVKQVQAHWGTLRDDRNPEREKVVEEMRKFLQSNRGDPVAGWKVFKNLCAQCHKIYGEGIEVGPDITVNGRSDFNQLLSNVFDPSLVIGAGYPATTVATTKGQVFTGLVTEDNPERIVLKTQGGKLETIPRVEVELVVVSKVSMMPEQLEKQLQPKEIADLFAFLCLDRPPGDPKAKLIPGTPR